MKITRIGEITGGQDGAIFKNFLFRFNAKGNCKVHEMGNSYEKISEFELDKANEIVPHSNAVQFGCEYFERDDEFPLLYTNVYNNYMWEKDKKKGVCLVYRITRNGEKFSSALVQKITIGFTEDELWKSCDEDVRPYGNFVIDKEKGRIYAFTMRDKDKTTRYFAFNCPKITDGENVVLEKEDVIEYFDCPYHYYIQGATCNKGKIYSTEGFSNDEKNAPAIRIIDLEAKKQIFCANILELGYKEEPEFIDFSEDGTCYYSDAYGNFYVFDEE